MVQILVDDLAVIGKDIAALQKRLVEYSAVCTKFSDSKLVQISEEVDIKIIEYMKKQMK